MAGLEPESIDALVCDPPYGLGKPPPIDRVLSAWLAGDTFEVSGGGFMGRKWDAFVPGPHFWRLAYRAMKPGAHGVVFAGQRTIDVMGIALRLAGFEVRDLVGWQYWSGFPKSHDVSKAIDRAAGAEREVVGTRQTGAISPNGRGDRNAIPTYGSGHTLISVTAPATPDAARWEGWGTALKPSIEPALLIRKPLAGTVAGNVLRYGTGGINVDGCRYPFGDPGWPGPDARQYDAFAKQTATAPGYDGGLNNAAWNRRDAADRGRWPANVYACPKASTAERERGCDELPAWSAGQLVDRKEGSAGMNNPRAGAGRTSKGRRNKHPTVKPVRLLRWLSRLVTPPGGTVLDPFAGSGSCGVAAVLEGFDYLGAELEADYQPIAEARIAHAVARPDQWLDTRPGLPVDDDTIEAAEAEAMGQIGLFGGGDE
jgi:site-specific DNA-methyltransferase (adenine-specific)